MSSDDSNSVVPGAGADRDRKAREDFVRGIVERGEAAPADGLGRLPPGATHEIVGHDRDGQPILERRRFSIV